MPVPTERLSLLTKDAILLYGEPVHLMIEETENKIEEICPGSLIGYDKNGVLIRKTDTTDKVHIPWVMVRSISGCPGKKKHDK